MKLCKYFFINIVWQRIRNRTCQNKKITALKFFKFIKKCVDFVCFNVRALRIYVIIFICFDFNIYSCISFFQIYKIIIYTFCIKHFFNLPAGKTCKKSKRNIINPKSGKDSGNIYSFTSVIKLFTFGTVNILILQLFKIHNIIKCRIKSHCVNQATTPLLLLSVFLALHLGIYLLLCRHNLLNQNLLPKLYQILNNRPKHKLQSFFQL